MLSVGCGESERRSNAPAEPAAGGRAASGGLAGSITGGSGASAGVGSSSGGSPASAGKTGSDSGGGAVGTGGVSNSAGHEASGGAADECEQGPVPEGVVYDGDLSILTLAALEQARQYSVVSGSLSVDLPEIELPLLTKVGGDFSSPSSVSVRLPNLREVGGSIYYYLNHDLVTLDLRRLHKVGGQVFIHRNLSLRELQIDSLLEVGEGCNISANLSLPDCYLDVVDSHCEVLHTTAPECSCARKCAVVDAQCQ
jgi:hypothetical protein